MLSGFEPRSSIPGYSVYNARLIQMHLSECRSTAVYFATSPENINFSLFRRAWEFFDSFDLIVFVTYVHQFDL